MPKRVLPERQPAVAKPSALDPMRNENLEIMHYELSIMHYELCIMLSRSAFKATEFALEFGFEDAFFAADDGAAI